MITDEMVIKALHEYVSGDHDTPEQAMRATLTAANAAAWRPIEELDKTDARRVILGIVRHGRIEEVHVGSFYWAINEDEVSCWWSDQADDEICPTHWMPLPAPPQQEGE